MKFFSFPSSSNPKLTHQVSVYPDGKITCTCMGFKTPTKCWHVKQIAEKEGLTVVIGGELIRPTAPVEQPQSLFESLAIPIKPMLASGMKDDEELSDFDPDKYVGEIKYDGQRMIIQRDDEITAWSRAGNIRRLSSKIIKAIEEMPYGIYDSELMIPGGVSTDVVRLDLLEKSELVLFDIMRVAGHSCTSEPLRERRKLLEAAVVNIPKKSPVTISEQFRPSEQELKKIWDAGGEGAVLKKWMSQYQDGYRSKDWVKVVQEFAGEAVITEFKEGRLGPHSIIVAVDKDGVQVRMKTLNDAWRVDFALNAAKYIGRTIRFKYREKTRDKKKYRHPMADHIL